MISRDDLAVTETIYEEDQEDASKSSSSPSQSSPCCSRSSFSLVSSLQSTVDEWSRATGSKTDIVVRVHDHCFYLHKDRLVSYSSYFRRHVDSESSVLTVSPPSTITVDTFAVVASFCYRSEISITPFNVAALRIAAEWLEMTDDLENLYVDDGNGDGNLLERAEWYFCQTLASSTEYAIIVLRSCLGLLPYAAESAAILAGRCVESLSLVDSVEEGRPSWLDELALTTTEEFQMVAEAIHDRLSDIHDLLYRIVDHYLLKCPAKLSEDERNRICSVVNCKKLSRPSLIHLVRNTRMPLRFVVQAMLVEQFHTRVSFLDRVCKNQDSNTITPIGSVTLGDILQRDAAIRQSAHLKSTMEATYFKIQSLELELSMMRRRLRETKEGKETEENKEEDEVVAVRSESCRFFQKVVEESDDGGSSKSSGIGSRVIRGLKSVFRMRSEKRSSGCRGSGDAVIASTSANDLWTPTTTVHRRNRSLS